MDALRDLLIPKTNTTLYRSLLEKAHASDCVKQSTSSKPSGCGIQLSLEDGHQLQVKGQPQQHPNPGLTLRLVSAVKGGEKDVSHSSHIFCNFW